MSDVARRSYRERFDVLQTAPRTLEACLALPAPEPVAVNDPAGAGVLADRLTAVLARITGARSYAARVLARQLLDGTTVAVDHAEQLRELWYRPAEEFVDGAYPALIGRPPAPASARRGSHSSVVGFAVASCWPSC